MGFDMTFCVIIWLDHVLDRLYIEAHYCLLKVPVSMTEDDASISTTPTAPLIESLPTPALLASPERSSTDQEQFQVGNYSPFCLDNCHIDGNLLPQIPVCYPSPPCTNISRYRTSSRLPISTPGYSTILYTALAAGPCRRQVILIQNRLIILLWIIAESEDYQTGSSTRPALTCWTTTTTTMTT